MQWRTFVTQYVTRPTLQLCHLLHPGNDRNVRVSSSSGEGAARPRVRPALSLLEMLGAFQRESWRLRGSANQCCTF